MEPTRMIPVTGPSITEKEVEYVTQAARDGWNANYIKYVTLFEEKFAEYVGRQHALATSSCTGALHLSYLALGLKEGDEVIVPNITWIASVEPLYYIGAKLVFVDVEPDTWCLDPKKIEEKITDKTKAILVVNIYGHVADMDPILEIAKKYNLKVLEDAAESVGSEYHGKMAGSFGDVSVFSFHGSKTMVTGEGGMLVTDDKDIVDKARYYNDHCKDPNKIFWNLEIGYKYKMSNFQAACGLAQLERIDELVDKKRQIFHWYEKRLSSVPGLQLNVERPDAKNSFWMVTVLFDKPIDKDQWMKDLGEKKIQARPFFYPISLLPAVDVEVDTPVALDVSSRGLNLPCAQSITEEEVDYVCKTLVGILNM